MSQEQRLQQFPVQHCHLFPIQWATIPVSTFKRHLLGYNRKKLFSLLCRLFKVVLVAEIGGQWSGESDQTTTAAGQ